VTSHRKSITGRDGDRIAKILVDNVVRFRAAGKSVMADMADGRSLHMPKKDTIRALAVEFGASFVCCAPGLLVPRLLLVRYAQGSREEGGGGWLRVVGSGKLVRVTDSYRNEVAEAVTQRRIEVALAGPSDAKVTAEEAYADGKKAWASCRANSPPRDLDRILRGWWMAGWNDADIERGDQA
jgi:hypothetical protein